MFIAIQEIQREKANKDGTYREFKVDSTSFTFNGVTKTSYSYNPQYDSGHFERPHREAYKISVHQSYRENGKVKTTQCVLGTIGYYSLAEDCPLYDYIASGLDQANEMFEGTENLYDLVEAKIAPIKKRIQREYHKTEEYKTVQERELIQKKYQNAKAAFSKKYRVDADEYDHCYDIFGHVMEPNYLNEIIRRAESYRSYSNYSYSNYSRQKDYRSYVNSNSSNYTDEEKQTLKVFYKKLAMEFHPDTNPGVDTTKEMQILNKLKEGWGI
jgi:hypothetical protein